MHIGETSREQISERLAELEGHFRERRDAMLGYQWSQRLDGYAELAPFLDYHLDNIGDPFSPSLTALNTKEFEREVLEYFAELWHARGPADGADPESYWGYVLSMGSTEGNLYAMWNARDYLSGSRLLDGSVGEQREPVLLYSADAHYSLAKGAAMLRIHTLQSLGESRYPGQCPVTADGSWPTAVPSLGGSTGTGRIDVAQLTTLVEFFVEHGHPPIIMLNLGSTFKGAYDLPEEVWAGVGDVLGRSGSGRQDYWIHIDGALGAGCLPYMEIAAQQGLLSVPGPKFDFRLPYVSSIVTSGHKWFGTPFPTGVYLSKQKFRVAPPSDPRYIGSPDTTFSGARNGLSSLLLWYAIASRSEAEQVQTVCSTLSLTEYLTARLRELEDALGVPLWVERAEHALAVRLRRPADDIVARYGLVGERTDDDRDLVHVFVMPHVSKETIDQLLADLAAPGAYES